MTLLENWEYDTYVVDEDFHAIECPQLSGGTLVCPAKECRSQFGKPSLDRREQKSLQHHLAAHGWDTRVYRECRRCGDEFVLDRRDSDQIHCSVDCRDDVDGRQRIDYCNALREHYGIATSDSGHLSKALLTAIHEDLIGTVLTGTKRRGIISNLRTHFGITGREDKQPNKHFMKQIHQTITGEKR